MPVKNAGKFLGECLDSVCEQTYTAWELIAIDDHSTDESSSILHAHGEKDERIRILKNKEHGIISALQLAYENSKGHFITRMDADDIMSPNKLLLLVQRLIDKGEKHIATGCVSYFSEAGIGDGYKKYAEWLNLLTKSESNFSEIYKECVIPSPCWMIRRKDFEDCGAFNSNTYPEDYDLCFRFYQSGFHIAGVPEVIHKWRDYLTRTSRTSPHYADNRFIGLKIDYFIQLDYQAESRLIVWGAGKKGKTIARKLLDKNIPFHWITNNNKKIGHIVYDQMLLSVDTFHFQSSDKVIVSVANEKEQQEIILQMQKLNTEFFLFC